MAPSHSASATVVRSGEYAVPRNTVVPSSARSPAAAAADAPLLRPLVPAPIRIGRRREPRGDRQRDGGVSVRSGWVVRSRAVERVLVWSARLPRSRLNLVADHDVFPQDFFSSLRAVVSGLSGTPRQRGSCQRSDQRERETAASAACHRHCQCQARPIVRRACGSKPI